MQLSPFSKLTERARLASWASVPCALLLLNIDAAAQGPEHPNTNSQKDMRFVERRPDVALLPMPLKNVLVRMAGRPHTYLPIQVNSEADDRSLLFQYYLLTTHGFEPNVFTSLIPGVNDTAMQTATGPNGGQATVGSVRLVVEPKPGLPTDPENVHTFIDVFTDLSGLFVINNESGWYEGWMIHDLVVPKSAPPRANGHAQFGLLLDADAIALKAIGAHHNTAGETFTIDGKPVRLPAEDDHFPDRQTNVVPVQLSMGAYNAMQQGDVHSYWEFNYTTNWIHPLYELPFTGGLRNTFEEGQVGALQSIVPGSGPSGVHNVPQKVGDNPHLPRDPDKFDAEIESQRESRERFIPSGLANEIYLDVYERVASFEPTVGFPQRLFDAYAYEISLVDMDGDGIISAAEGDPDSNSDGFKDNDRLFLPATAFTRFAVTREIDDGLLAPRFAPSQRAWVLTGAQASVNPPVPASTSRDGDDR